MNILVQSDTNYVDGNTCRRGALTNKTGYGIYVSAGSNSYIGNNDTYDGGTTAAITDLGTNTRRSSKLQLDYIAATDLAAGTATVAGTWLDVTANQTFRVDSVTSVVEIALTCHVFCGNSGAANTEWSLRLNIDSAGTPILKKISGSMQEVATSYVGLPGGVVKVTGLAIGNHTVKVQVISTVNATVFCRASSQPNYEHLNLQVAEYQR